MRSWVCLPRVDLAGVEVGFPGIVCILRLFWSSDEWQDCWGVCSPEVWDAAADAVGAFSGLLLSMVFWRAKGKLELVIFPLAILRRA